MVHALINSESKIKLVFDTGATHTTIDSNTLEFLELDFSKRLDSVFVETGKGIVLTDRYILPAFSALGLAKKEFVIQVYDFLSNGVLSEYDGILGLDFLEGYHFCVDTLNNQITIHE